MPCCPRDCFNRWNLLPYNNLPKIFGTWALTMPGPLSSTTTRKRPSCDSCSASRPRSWTSTRSSGRIEASSQASSELSTASLMVVSSAFEGLSKPSRWRFLAKNSETEISRCFEAIDSAVTRGVFGAERGAGAGSRGGSTAGADAGGASALVAFETPAAALAGSAPNKSSCGFWLFRAGLAPAFSFCFATSLPRITAAPRLRSAQTRQSSIARATATRGPLEARLAGPERIRWRA